MVRHVFVSSVCGAILLAKIHHNIHTDAEFKLHLFSQLKHCPLTV